MYLHRSHYRLQSFPPLKKVWRYHLDPQCTSFPRLTSLSDRPFSTCNRCGYVSPLRRLATESVTVGLWSYFTKPKTISKERGINLLVRSVSCLRCSLHPRREWVGTIKSLTYGARSFRVLQKVLVARIRFHLGSNPGRAS